jgi:hypothetical protein
MEVIIGFCENGGRMSHIENDQMILILTRLEWLIMSIILVVIKKTLD